jgi:2-polyprenyl-6-methoxyphenol hydroxylase-like FAD-dependent oxidoreductase
MKRSRTPHNDRIRGDIKVAIIGGSYSGLSLANALHLNSIQYTIFDRRSLPYTHVMGGSGFDVPSFTYISNRLDLKQFATSNAMHSPTRKNVIDTLMTRVNDSLLPEHNIVGINKKDSSFYLTIETKSNDNTKRRQQKGPYHIVVGADGVVSTCRKSTYYEGMFLVGDARWVNDRWFDLGLRRIDRGADIAMLDGLQLGEAICNSMKCSPQIQAIMIRLVQEQTNHLFCARAIHKKKLLIRGFVVLAILFALLIRQFFA